PEVVRALDAEDLAVVDFRLHAPTLDDVFLAKTGRKLASEAATSREARGSAEPEPEADPVPV
ncbi:MAG: ABC transporter, partial [Actinomycetota bacterium]|nr:ABC transporter [Actinomycetota bacterium]